MPDLHFPISPSGLSRGLNCPAALHAGNSNNPAGAAADEGTAAHLVAEVCLLTGGDAAEFVGDSGTAAAVQVYADEVTGTIRDHGCQQLLIEATLGPLSEELPLGGTVDCALLDAAGCLHIFDYKHGEGVPVVARENTQLAAYGLLLVELFDLQPTSVELVVVQPRCRMKAEPVDRWSTDVAYLQALNQRIRSVYLGPRDQEVPGDHCRWCPRRSECESLAKLRQQLAVDAFSATDIDVETLCQMVLVGPTIRANLKEAEQTLLGLGKRGEPLPGMKLVASYGHRRWSITDEAELLASLKKLGIPRTKASLPRVLTPAQLSEVLGGDKKFAELVIRPSKGATVVPLNDRRAAIEIPRADDLFAES